jgi:hypothetical protein
VPRSKPGEPPPFPESLCHSCGAPPRYVTTDRGSVFIYCPLLRCYPGQPVLACEAYRPVPPATAPETG